MKFSVATNFDDRLIAQLPAGKVASVFGKLAVDCVGGGRSHYLLPRVTKKDVARHVVEARKKGIEFNYLLNALCVGNKEFDRAWQKEFRKLLDWLTEIRVDSVTVAIPFLARLIRREYPHFKINASSLAHIDTLERARYWQDLGADVLVLRSVALNRDFGMLERIREHVRVPLELIANNACLDRCPMSVHHGLAAGHASQAQDHKTGPRVNYFLSQCRLRRLEDPVSFIRSDWIRPEDIRHYEDMGIDYLKIVDRSQSTRFLINAVQAYARGRYDGNLADLFPYAQAAPFAKAYIDNRALDGFLRFFVKGLCKKGVCEECGYCASVAKKAVRVNKEEAARAAKKSKEVLSEI